MYTLEIGDIMEVRAWCTFGDQAAVNVTHYRVNSEVVVGAAVTDQEFIDALEPILAPLYKGAMSEEGFWNGLQGTAINVTPPPITVESIANRGVGTDGANGLPGQVSGLIEFYTNFRGPSHRGRLYIPFVPKSRDGAMGKPDATYRGELGDMADAYVGFTGLTNAGLSVLTCTLIVANRKATPITGDVVISRGVSSSFATQKKRGAFGRQNRSPI